MLVQLIGADRHDPVTYLASMVSTDEHMLLRDGTEKDVLIDVLQASAAALNPRPL